MDLELLDLSFLTDGERATIIAVLDRDGVIREQEEKRIRHLRDQHGEKFAKTSKFILFTGDWFHSTRTNVSKAYNQTSLVIRESLRCKGTPDKFAGQKPSHENRVKEFPVDQDDLNAESSITTDSEKPRSRTCSVPKEKSVSLQEVLAILSSTSPIQRRRSLSTTRTVTTLKVTEREKAIFDALSRKDENSDSSKMIENAEPFFIIKDKISTDPTIVRNMVQKETVNTTGTTQPPKKRTVVAQQSSYYTSFR